MIQKKKKQSSMPIPHIKSVFFYGQNQIFTTDDILKIATVNSILLFYFFLNSISDPVKQ
jgi:hypothetical protein